jgi:sucrose-6-phosphate hydrolase SacC (GH32 family)
MIGGMTAYGQDSGEKVFEFETVEEPVAVLLPGAEGEWDSSATFAPIIVQDDDMLYMFYTGAGSGMSDLAIGLATSTDGEEWTKYSGNPIFQHNGSASTSVGAVTVIDGNWVMIYTEPTTSGSPDKNLFRATAESPEGPWTNDADPVMVGTSGRWDRNVWPQSLIHVDDEYRLYYIGLNQFQQFPQIGLATSPDSINWTRFDDPEITDAEYVDTDPILRLGEADEWDFLGLSTSNILQTEAGWELFYVGYDRSMFTSATNYLPLQLGYATSEDGIHWEKYEGGPVLDTGEVAAPLINVAKIDETYHIYYDINFGSQGIGVMSGTIETE